MATARAHAHCAVGHPGICSEPRSRLAQISGGYWPKSQTPPNQDAWDKTAKAFRADHKALIKLVEDESTDLLAKIPHGDSQTVLREILLAADHTAYHLGAFVLLRRLLGEW